jgi:integrase
MPHYYLIKRHFTIKGKKVTKYYYQYTNPVGKKVQRSIEREMHLPRGSLRWKDAKRYVEELNFQANKNEEQGNNVTLEVFAENFFTENCEWLARKKEKHGLTLKNKTIMNYRNDLEKHILPEYGKRLLCEIDGIEVEDWLLTLPLANSSRNNIIIVLRTVLREAKRKKLLKTVPELEAFSRRTARRRDTLTFVECETLFPEDIVELKRIWTSDNNLNEDEYAGLMYGVLFGFMLSAGLRSGEGRALSMAQLFPKYNGIIVDRAFSSTGELDFPKKGDRNDPRYRAVIVPSKGWRLLNIWLNKADPEDYIFTLFSKPLLRDYLFKRFEIGLKNAGIEIGDRWLTPHSLRYTWVSRMQPLLRGDDLRAFAGHRSEEMTDHYSRPYLLERLETYQEMRHEIDRFWQSA